MMIKVIRKMLKKEKGQSMVEFALLMPLLCLILLGIIEFGRVFNAYLVITNASREGARIAVVGSSDAAIIQRVEDIGISLKQDQLSCSITPATRTRGEKVAVSVDYQVKLIAPLISEVIPNPLPLRAITSMRVE